MKKELDYHYEAPQIHLVTLNFVTICAISTQDSQHDPLEVYDFNW